MPTGRNVPFFVDKPDENLVRYVEQLEIPVNRVLELGSGPGRNALYLAEHGSQVGTISSSSASSTKYSPDGNNTR